MLSYGRLHTYVRLKDIITVLSTDFAIPELINPVDNELSGILLFARSLEAKALLQKHFRERRILFMYWALTNGSSVKKGIVRTPLTLSEKDSEPSLALKSGGIDALVFFFSYPKNLR